MFTIKMIASKPAVDALYATRILRHMTETLLQNEQEELARVTAQWMTELYKPKPHSDPKERTGRLQALETLRTHAQQEVNRLRNLLATL